LAAARLASAGEAHAPPRARSVLRLGGWLVMANQGDQLGNFVGIALLGSLAGATAVGEFEAARQLAQPLFVVATGLMAVLRPRVMSAAQHADEPTARRFSAVYAALLAVCGVGYALVAGVQWPGNPLVDVFPNAFRLDWMLPALSVATAVAFFTPMLGIQAISARREREMTWVNTTNQVVYIGAVAALAVPLGALAMPAASALNSFVLFARFRPLLRRIYLGPATVPASG
jgi:O-antigen/teichoic acid export membrane protein